MAKLTARRLEILESVMFSAGRAINYAGTDQRPYQALVGMGLLTFRAGHRPQWNRYGTTELGEQVLCAAKLDAGMLAAQ